VTWFEAYAFCIWDGGFLPTEAEWNFAASGGAEQRIFPWGSQDPGPGPAYAAWGCFYGEQGVCTGATADIAYVNDIPGGVGLWGQWNLAGNLDEWTLDGYEAPYPTPCVDCAAPDMTQKVFRGGSFETEERFIHNAYRGFGDPATRDVEIGFRCARSP
jgi:formylglycine-generating enzyme